MDGRILPKKGSYPINKQGPRYINLVDPRGNRKSIRVQDSTLWEKLRLVESTRSKKKIPSKKHASKETETISKMEPVSENILEGSANQIAEPALIPPVPETSVINEKINTAPETELAPQPFQPAEIHELPPEVARPEIPESPPVESTDLGDTINRGNREKSCLAGNIRENSALNSKNPFSNSGLDSLDQRGAHGITFSSGDHPKSGGLDARFEKPDRVRAPS